jgi:cytoskeletal protein RodZ
MRENEDEFRRFVPLMRRIVILLAVIVAVPVILWTVTALVRAYLGPPKLPVFHQLASSASTDGPIAANADSPESDQSFAGPEQGKLADSSSAIVDARAMAADARDPLAPTKGASPSDRPAEASGAEVAPKLADISAPPPAAPADTNAPGMAATEVPGAFDAAAASSAFAVATAPQTDAMPGPAPLTGPIPLPPPRPRALALANANVPIPRPRPGLAPSAPPPEAASSNATPLEFLQNLFH